MSDDGLDLLKKRQREMWASFAPTATYTTPVAAHLVRFADVQAGARVLDVGCGTGVVAITAALMGAQVTGLDLTPELLAHARENGRISGCADITWTEGDAEDLPYPDGSFDIILSQFGHMFAPRPAIAVSEMRRVLKPGGRIAFATWPPELFVGKMFSFVAGKSPPPPPGASPPPQWGDVGVVTKRLGELFEAPFFERGVMSVPALSLSHFRCFMETSVGPMQKLVENLGDRPDELAATRAEFEALAAPYYSANLVHQGYLLTRAGTR